MQDTFLFVNLGSPKSPSVSDVSEYLGEFLMDPFVIDIPWIFRYLLVRGIVCRFRSPKTAKAYESIWTPEGSPLLVHTKNMIKKLGKKVDHPLFLAMTYGRQSIAQALKEIQILHAKTPLRLHLFPLFPHHAMSTTQAVVHKVRSEMKKLSFHIPLNIVKPFFDNPHYINALWKTTRPYSLDNYDHVLFSFHGLPERHLFKTDPSKKHCLKVENCCEKDHIATKTCYRSQVLQSLLLLTKKMNLSSNKWSLAFQSRFGRDKWLDPNTVSVLEELLRENKKKVLLITPAFVADCLETLEEIHIQAKELFLKSGGERFDTTPCLNDSEPWIDALDAIVQKHLETFSDSSQKTAVLQ